MLGLYTALYTGGKSQLLTPSSIDSAEVIPSPALGIDQFPVGVGIPSEEAFGTTSAYTTATLNAIGIAAGAAGTPVLKPVVEVDPVAIATAESVSNPFLAIDQQVTPTSIPTEESVSTPNTWTITTLYPPSIAPSAVGTPRLNTETDLFPPSINSSETFGTPWMNAKQTVVPDGIPSEQAVPAPYAYSAVTLNAVAIAPAAVGTPVLKPVTEVDPVPINSAESVPSPVLSIDQQVTPTGIPSEQTFGTTIVNMPRTMTGVGIASSETFGTATLTPNVTLYPVGVVTGETGGTPKISTITVLNAVGIAQQNMGIPVLSTGPVTMVASGIPSGQAVSVPTLFYPEEMWNFLPLI